MRLHSERGFTLIEIVMASLILVLGMTIISSIIANVTRKNFYSHRHTQAVMLAQNKIEELLNDGYNSANLADGDYENPLNPVNSTGDSSGIFYQYWMIEDLRPIPRSKQITSWIEWEGTDGELKTIMLAAVCIDQNN
ncbi:MAG: prepilin-type N-terminal cleavage/methylation domain-containing protein [Candidatus Latescibacteria bacterium]|nr:prepilin-type N-terminal cleavage/methylation domain-containing protein [Candidatus Latescibacterota bacterium]